mgnify:CR=1 FL=1
MRGERGSALVQVLIMSVLLVLLATSLLKVMFANHMVTAKVKNATDYKYLAEACMNIMFAQWQGTPCAGGNTSCTLSHPSGSLVTVNASCTGNRVDFRVTY